MIQDLQLAAISVQGAARTLYRIPMEQALQARISAEWSSQYVAFAGRGDGNANEIAFVDFHPGYSPDEDERFRVPAFPTPDWIGNTTSRNVNVLPKLSDHEGELDHVRGIAGFAAIDGREMVLFQAFSSRQIIEPGRFLFLETGTYTSSERRGLALANKLAAVLNLDDHELDFANYRVANAILSLENLYRDASEEEIRDVLSHALLACRRPDTFAVQPSQWFRKHFAMLRDSRVLDYYTARQLQARARRVGLQITTRNKQIVFPETRSEARRVLQFLNEMIFRGVITNRLMETNSARSLAE